MEDRTRDPNNVDMRVCANCSWEKPNTVTQHRVLGRNSKFGTDGSSWNTTGYAKYGIEVYSRAYVCTVCEHRYYDKDEPITYTEEIDHTDLNWLLKELDRLRAFKQAVSDAVEKCGGSDQTR